MPKPYSPHETEQKIYRRWERAKAFTPSAKPRRGRKPFVIVIPPPNITGSLHMGHALQDTLMDVLTRYHRIKGDDTLWVPGTDHAGIATQNIVEKELRKEGKTRNDLGREAFVERVWRWKEQYGRRITEQLQRLGASCDWTRERFTLDPEYVRAVQEAFIHYAQKGLIYRGDRIVSWCPRCASSISDLEVKYEEREGTLYYVKYPISAGGRGHPPTPDRVRRGDPGQEAGGDDAVTVATTRPETMLGDTAVAVHPSDDRYTALIGKTVKLPLAEREIPILADRAVESAFGTGALKVTPAHDHADADIGERHHLPVINVIGEDGRMTDVAPQSYRGLPVEEARERVLADLRTQGLVEKEEIIRHRVALCERCGTSIQPLVSKQWFVKMTLLAQPAMAAVEKDLVRYVPERWAKTARAWLQQVKDWCISRQLWWGHRIPAWYCQAGIQPAVSSNQRAGTDKAESLHAARSTLHVHVVFSTVKPRRCPECGGKEFVQDPDVLDTWFSSALWPFAVFGWPEATADLRRFYPTAVLTTAPEIIHLWVARMLFSGLEFMNRKTYLPAKRYGKRTLAQQVPFRDVLIHQTVLNLKGQRMSKSLGTGVDPMELIEEFGADATRFGLLIQSHRDQQALRFDVEAVRSGRNFVNKLWNIGRFLNSAGGRRQEAGGKRPTSYKLPATSFDQWILSRLSEIQKAVTDALQDYRFGDALRALHAFVWDDFADWYVEASKVPGIATSEVGRQVFRTVLQLLHPFLPFVTEEIWAGKKPKEWLILTPWPVLSAARARSTVTHVAAVQSAVRAIRSAKTLLGIAPSKKIRARVRGPRGLEELFPVIAFLAGCSEVVVKGTAANWVPLPAEGTTARRRGPAAAVVRVAIYRDAVVGIDRATRLRAAGKRVADTQARVKRLEKQRASMRGKASAEAFADVTSRLEQARGQLTEHEQSVTILRYIVKKYVRASSSVRAPRPFDTTQGRPE